MLEGPSASRVSHAGLLVIPSNWGSLDRSTSLRGAIFMADSYFAMLATPYRMSTLPCGGPQREAYWLEQPVAWRAPSPTDR